MRNIKINVPDNNNENNSTKNNTIDNDQILLDENTTKNEENNLKEDFPVDKNSEVNENINNDCLNVNEYISNNSQNNKNTVNIEDYSSKNKSNKKKKIFKNENKIKKDKKHKKGKSKTNNVYQINEFENEINNDELSIDNRIAEEYKNRKKKKIATTFCLFSFMGMFAIFGTYNTFFKEELDPKELAVAINSLNADTPFPVGGVKGFIDQNFKEMLNKNLRLDSGTDSYNVQPFNIHINNIDKKSAFVANVYVTALVESNLGAFSHNFVIPISYDYKTKTYSSAGELQITPNQSNNSTKDSDNKQLSFEGIPKEKDEKIFDSAQTFVNNFLIMVYNQKVDLSLYYTGHQKLGDDNIKFERVDSFELYSKKNKDGYNAKATYTLKLSEGVTYKTTSYFEMEKSGNSWVIKSIL